MFDLFWKILACTLTSCLIFLIFGWVKNGTGNQRIFYFGLMPVLLSISILIFDYYRHHYNPAEYTTKEIVVRKCSFDKQFNGEITASDDSVYMLNRSLLRRAGNSAELANSICAHQNLQIRLNAENEISGVESEGLFIPLEVGIARDNSKHDFSILVLLFAPLGLLLMAMALIYDRLGKKIEIPY